MKLKYEKPLIAVEHYELSQAIAACEIAVGFYNDECIAQDKDVPEEVRDLAKYTYFFDACDLPVKDMEITDKVCYHTSASTLFGS